MSPRSHHIYIGVLVSIVVATFFFLCYAGYSYYTTSLEERFYHPDHAALKPSGVLGHGLGIVGTLLILIGVFGYMIRKRNRSLQRVGVLKYWLEFHIFLCTLGPVMILFHTAFKFGGIVSVSFWSMVAVVASGVVGRFIYRQIPRTIQGRELSLQEIRDLKNQLNSDLKTHTSEEAALDFLKEKPHVKKSNKEILFSMWGQYFEDRTQIKNLKQQLQQNNFSQEKIKEISSFATKELSMLRRIERLQLMQKLFRYWHVAHLPFAIIMLLIMIVHVIVTISFGARWIF